MIGQTLLVKQAACELHQDVKWVQNAAWGRSGGDFSPIQLISSAARRYSNKQSPTPVRWIAALPAFPTCSWLKSASAKVVQLSSGQSTKTGLFLSVYFKSVLKVPADLCAVVAVVTMNWTHSTEDGGRDGGRLCGCGSYSVCKNQEDETDDGAWTQLLFDRCSRDVKDLDRHTSSFCHQHQITCVP